jgi:hypothetical protein
MEPHVSSTANGVYRTPGRAPAPERIAPPSFRTLLGPLARTVAAIALVAGAIAVFNALAPSLFGTSGAVRLIPSVDWIQNALSLAMPLALVALVVLVARRVRPSWGGLRLRGKLLYVTSILVVQAGVVVAAEAAVFFSRGGLHLFEPSHLSSTWLPDGRTAHVYTRGGLRCGYDVFVSGPLSLTATHAFEISRATCLEPTPRVRANPDGTLDLVDPSDQPLEPQSSPGFSFGHHGC